MTEPTYQLTDQQEYAQFYPGWDGHHPDPAAPPEQKPSDEQADEYLRYYPTTDPVPRMSDEDERVYSSYFPNLQQANSDTEENH